MTPEEEDELIRRLRAERAAQEVKADAIKDDPGKVFGVTRPVRPKRERQVDPGDGGVDRVEDVLKTAPWYLPKAAMGLLGMPHDAGLLADTGVNKVIGMLPEGAQPYAQAVNPVRLAVHGAGRYGGLSALPGAEDYRNWFTDLSGIEIPDPKSRIGKFLDTFGQATVPFGGPLRKADMAVPFTAARREAVREVGSEPAKQAVRMAGATAGGTEVGGMLNDDDPFTRAMFGIAGGGANAAREASNSRVGSVLNKALGPRSKSDIRLAQLWEQLGLSERYSMLGSDSFGLGHGLPSDILGSLGGSKIMADFLDRRKAQFGPSVENRLLWPTLTPGTPRVDAQGMPIRPPTGNPADNIFAAKRAAHGAIEGLPPERRGDPPIEGIKQRAQQAVAPYFDPNLPGINPNEIADVNLALRGNRQFYGEGSPERALMTREADQLDPHSGTGAPPMNPRLAHNVYTGMRDPVSDAFERGDPRAAHVLKPGVDAMQDAIYTNPYLARGMDLHRSLAQRLVEPQERGFLGRVAEGFDPKKPISGDIVESTAKQLTDPRVSRPGEIRSAAQRMTDVDPEAFIGLAQTHFENAINKAMKGDTGGGAHKIWKELYGSRQLAENTDAAMRGVAMAHGVNPTEYIAGVRNIMALYERGGGAIPVGSRTAPRKEMQDTLSGSNVAAIADIPSAQPVRSFSEKMRELALYTSNKKLAEILTAPNSVDLIVKAAKVRPNSLTMRYITAALFGLGKAESEP